MKTLGFAPGPWLRMVPLAVLVAQHAVANDAQLADLRAAHELEKAALRSGDPHVLGAAFTEGAVIVPSGGEVLSGRQAIVSRYTERFSTSRSDPKTKILDLAISGDWALERFQFETTITPLAGGSTSLATGYGVHVYRLGPDGVWWIAYDTFRPAHLAE